METPLGSHIEVKTFSGEKKARVYHQQAHTISLKVCASAKRKWVDAEGQRYRKE